MTRKSLLSASETKELQSEIVAMQPMKRFFIIGVIPIAIYLIAVFIYQRHVFEFVLAFAVIMSAIVYYIIYLSLVFRFRKDISHQYVYEVTTGITKIKGKNEKMVFQTKSNVQINFDDLKKSDIDVEDLNPGTIIKLKYAKFSKHVFNIQLSN